MDAAEEALRALGWRGHGGPIGHTIPSVHTLPLVTRLPSFTRLPSHTRLQELIERCVAEDLPVISALGAGGKANPCQLHVSRLGDVFSDPIGTALLKRLKKRKQEGSGEGGSGEGAIAWWDDIPNRVWVVHSSELQKVSLLPLPEGVQRADELGSQPNFRVRVMPVMPPVSPPPSSTHPPPSTSPPFQLSPSLSRTHAHPTLSPPRHLTHSQLPAAFGAALASHAISVLSGVPPSPPPLPVPALTGPYQRKLYQKYLTHETKDRKCPPIELKLSFDDVCTVVVDVFRCRCALTGCRLHDPGPRQFCLCRCARPR